MFLSEIILVTVFLNMILALCGYSEAIAVLNQISFTDIILLCGTYKIILKLDKIIKELKRRNK